MDRQKQRPRALTVGGALMDTIAVIGAESIERISMTNAHRSFLLLEQGSKTEAEIVSTHPGGGALNAAVSFARLGFETAALIKIGNDDRGAAIRKCLNDEKISGEFVATSHDAPTGASVLISAHDRNAAIFTFRGANTKLLNADLHPQAFERDIVYVAGLSDKSADCFPEIARLAGAAGAFVATNPGVRQLTSRGDAFEESLRNIDLLCLNVREIEALVPRLSVRSTAGARKSGEPSTLPPSNRVEITSGNITMTLTAIFLRLAALGVKCVVVTDGKRGAYAASAEEICFCPALQLDVVGTAGAGDAFNSTFAAHYATGSSISEALQAATVNSGSVVMAADTQTGLLTKEALAANLERLQSQLPVQTALL
jgi:ribokinase